MSSAAGPGAAPDSQRQPARLLDHVRHGCGVLTQLAVDRDVSASIENQAQSALVCHRHAQVWTTVGPSILDSV